MCRMKIILCEFHQETNSFTPFASTRKDYEVFGIQKGQNIIDNVDEGCALEGMLHVLKDSEAEIIPSYRMWANAAGPVEDGVVDEFIEHVLETIEKNMPVDGICISMHGATQSQSSDDVCGDILKKLRDIVGENTVIAATFDLHANITRKISEKADIICGYHTYPHVDFYDVGKRAASLCIKQIKESQKLYMKHWVVPMIEPASGYTTRSGEFAELMSWAESLVCGEKLVDFSIFQMQPWLDVSDAQTSIITYSVDAENSYGLTMAKQLVNMRDILKPELNSVESIIAEAENSVSGKPVIIVDSADSPNAGASGDSAYVLGEICRLQSDIKGAIALCCKPAVDKAFKLGVGKTGEFIIGASISPEMSEPVKTEGKVVSLHDGYFIQEGPAKRGLENYLGPVAVIKVRNTTVILTSDFLLGPGDLQLFRHFGVEPTLYQMVTVKACTSFRAGYEQITNRIFDADTPGAAGSSLTRFKFKKLPETFYPFNDISYSDINEYKI